MTEAELKEYALFQDNRTLLLTDENQKEWLCKIYSDVFQVPYFKPKEHSKSAPYFKMVERLDLLIKTQKQQNENN